MAIQLSVIQVQGAMITPAVLISAAGTLVLSTANRLNRLLDRVRATAAAAADKLCQEPSRGEPQRIEARKQAVTELLETLTRRALMLGSALTALYFAIGILVATSIAVGVDATFDGVYSWIPVMLEITGTFVLLYGSFLLMREARLAVGSLLQETEAAKRAIEEAQRAVLSLPPELSTKYWRPQESADRSRNTLRFFAYAEAEHRHLPLLLTAYFPHHGEF